MVLNLFDPWGQRVGSGPVHGHWTLYASQACTALAGTRASLPA